jgi:hypothetical protein
VIEKPAFKHPMRMIFYIFETIFKCNIFHSGSVLKAKLLTLLWEWMTWCHARQDDAMVQKWGEEKSLSGPICIPPKTPQPSMK